MIPYENIHTLAINKTEMVHKMERKDKIFIYLLKKNYIELEHACRPGVYQRIYNKEHFLNS